MKNTIVRNGNKCFRKKKKLWKLDPYARGKKKRDYIAKCRVSII